MNELQGQQWLKDRAGLVTASCFSKVMAKGQGKTRRSYMLKLAAEILTGQPQETYQSPAMERGLLLEDAAIAEYEFITGNSVTRTGYIALTDRIGGSPDGLVGDEGIIEVKSVLPTTQIEYVLAGKVPSEYRAQIQGYLMITGRAWCDFISYCPDIKSSKYIFIKRVFQDFEYHEEMMVEINKFIDELNALVEAMQ